MTDIADERKPDRIVAACIIYNLIHPADPPRFLLIHRHPLHPVFPGLWGVPSGGVEQVDRDDPDLDPLEAAARRETLEESGLVVGQLTRFGEFHFHHPDRGYVHGTRFYAPYLGGTVVLDLEKDATEYRWATAREASRLALLPDLQEELMKLHDLLMRL